MTDKRWRANLYTPQSTSLSTTNVYYRTTVLGGPVTIRGPILRPLLGRSEAQPWTVDLLDDGSSFTAKLSDSSGRLWLLGRILSVERNLGGAGFTFQGAGRITDVQLGHDPDIAYYRLTIEDERRIERQATLFNTTNTTRLYPAGPHSNYGPYLAPPKGTVTVLYRSSLNTKWAYVGFQKDSVSALSGVAAQLIRQDLKAFPSILVLGAGAILSSLYNTTGTGNFVHLRLRVGANDFGIISLGDAMFQPAAGTVKHKPTVDWLKTLDSYKVAGTAFAAWVWATSSQLGLGTVYSSAFLHMFSAPPSEGTPLHIASTAGPGLHPITVLKRVYGGTYSTVGTIKVRYSTAAMDLLAASVMPLVRYRVTGPAIMADWLEQNIFQPFMIAPVVDSQGRVAPVSMRLPNSTSAITKTLSGSNVRQPYPTWDHIGREQVTQLRLVTESGDNPWLIAGYALPYAIPLSQSPVKTGGDNLATFPTTQVANHDRIGNFGIKPLTIRALGLHWDFTLPSQQQVTQIAFDGNVGSLQYPPTGGVAYQSWLQRDIFDRFGDGPSVARILGLSTAEVVNPGDWVKVQLPLYPNAPNRVRGGTLVAQVEQRDDTPAGPEFQVRYAGPALSPPAAPTVTLSTSTGDPKHAVKVAVGGVPARLGWRAEIIGSSNAPSSASSGWTPVLWGNTTSPQFVGNLPAGKTWWMRAAVTQPGRLRSAWTLSTKKTTQSLSAPTALATTGPIKKTFFTGAWTAGESDPPFTDIHVDTSTVAALGSSNRYARLSEPGITRARVENLASKTKYLLAVRHADPFGGYSAAAKIAVTTSSGASTGCPVPLGLTILMGA